MKYLKEKDGITLIALIITILVLLILAEVTISFMLGEKGIIEQAKNAQQKLNESKINDETLLSDSNTLLSKHLNGINSSRDGLTETQVRSIVQQELISRLPGTAKNIAVEERKMAQSSNTIAKNTNTTLDTFSFGNKGYKTGKAIITFCVRSNTDANYMSEEIDVYNGTTLTNYVIDNSVNAWGGGTLFSDSTICIEYDQNTNIQFCAYIDVAQKVSYNYSIMIFEDTESE